MTERVYRFIDVEQRNICGALASEFAGLGMLTRPLTGPFASQQVGRRRHRLPMQELRLALSATIAGP